MCWYILPLPADTITSVQQGIFVTCDCVKYKVIPSIQGQGQLTWCIKAKAKDKDFGLKDQGEGQELTSLDWQDRLKAFVKAKACKDFEHLLWCVAPCQLVTTSKDHKTVNDTDWCVTLDNVAQGHPSGEGGQFCCCYAAYVKLTNQKPKASSHAEDIHVWKGGFWDTMENLGVVSNAAVLSGLFAVTYKLVLSEIDDLVAPKYSSRVIGISTGISISGRNSVSSTFPCSWPSYHGGGRSCTRTGHSRCRIGFPGCWDGTQLARQIGETYVTVEIRFHIY